MNEVWKKIKQYPGYEASNLGRIRSFRHKNGYRKKPYYLKISMYRNERYYRIVIDRKHIPIHTLILLAFVGECPEGMECRHLDGDRKNNKITNLKWGTHQENENDKLKHDSRPKWEKHGCARLKNKQVIKIKEDLMNKIHPKIIADKYKVSVSTIWDIKYGHTWKELDACTA